MPLPLECFSHGGWHIALSSLEDLAALETKWIELQSRAECSFFQSWGWVSSWIGALPPRLRPQTLEVRLDDRIVGLALLGSQKIWRYGIVPSNALFVTETGSRQFDCLTVEHNGFLVESGLSKAVLLEGLEVVFIVIAVGAGRGLLIPAGAGALAACLLVALAGFFVHRPLSRVPENSLKFAVGVMLSAFGIFWTGEGLGVPWPGEDLAIVGFAALFLVAALAAVAVVRRPAAEVSA